MALGDFTPDLQLQTLFVLDEKGRITSTREPAPGPGPVFALIRGRRGSAWGVHTDVPDETARRIDELAREEPDALDLRDAPIHATRYLSLLGGRTYSGPAFAFPDAVPEPSGVGIVRELAFLEKHFRGWTAEELPGRSPILAVVDDGHAISVCFCARRSGQAAEAGVETAAEYRGRGLAARVTAAWALAVRSSGRLPIYSTSWTNTASRSVARKLGLVACATDWSLWP